MARLTHRDVQNRKMQGLPQNHTASPGVLISGTMFNLAYDSHKRFFISLYLCFFIFFTVNKYARQNPALCPNIGHTPQLEYYLAC